MNTKKSTTKSGGSNYTPSFSIKVTTTHAPDGSRLEKPISVRHMNEIRNRRVKKKEY